MDETFDSSVGDCIFMCLRIYGFMAVNNYDISSIAVILGSWIPFSVSEHVCYYQVGSSLCLCIADETAIQEKLLFFLAFSLNSRKEIQLTWWSFRGGVRRFNPHCVGHTVQCD